MNIGADHSQLVLRRFRQPHWRLCEMKSQNNPHPLRGKQTHPHRGARFTTHLPRSRRSSELLLRLCFGLYTCTFLHRSPLRQTGAKASQSCQILSSGTAFPPFSSTLLSEWGYKEKRSHSCHRANNTAVLGLKKQSVYILSFRYTLELQKRSFQHHLLRLDTRGQQHAGHPHWGGVKCWEDSNNHNIWSEEANTAWNTPTCFSLRPSKG